MERWTGTYSGGKFFTLNPERSKINIEDIAHSLSQICRFAGHSKHFYSVGQHCVNIYKTMKKDKQPCIYQLYGLLHDASEAFYGDMLTPIKQCLPDYKKWEEKAEKHIYKSLGINPPDIDATAVIKLYDEVHLYNEARILMSNHEAWVFNSPIERDDIEIEDVPIKTVEEEYLKIFYELINNINIKNVI